MEVSTIRETTGNICFTAAQWLQHAASINELQQQALTAGLMIGASVGGFFVLIGIWYRGRSEQHD